MDLRISQLVVAPIRVELHCTPTIDLPVCNAYVASAILALLSELTTTMTEYHQNDIPLVCIGVDLP